MEQRVSLRRGRATLHCSNKRINYKSQNGSKNQLSISNNHPTI